MTPRLDPEDALAGPLYFVAAMLVVVPIVDFVLSVPAPEFSSTQWRFSTLGLLSGHMLLPVLGLAMLFVVSAILRHYTVQRVLVIICLTTAVLFALLSWRFFSDTGSQRFTVVNADIPAFTSASNRALFKLILTAVALAYMGWRARRMIPAPTRHKTPKPVHVISK